MPLSIKASGLKERVDKLLSAMTLDQKIGQMTQAERLTCTPQDVKKYHLGSILSGAGSYPGTSEPAEWVTMNDAYWQASMEADEGHLAIPLLYGVDAVHGHNNVKGATIFPHNIGLGAANDTDLIERIADITAIEVLATGVDWTYAPNLAVARDCHWGRTYESFSEDPEIVSSYAGKIVKKLQNNSTSHSVLACAKHWVGDGGTKYGVDHGDSKLTRKELEDHILPYYSALDAGVLTIMASYSSWNGDKCHSHKYLLTDVLKKQMGFEGFVVSDMQGIDYLGDDFYLSIEQSVNAGIDMFMLPQSWKVFIENLRNHVELGTISMERIDDAVRRILSVKVACGLFEDIRPLNRSWANHESVGCQKHRDVAREAVRKSLVLLKNKNNILPLKKTARILVAGKNAHNKGHQCGGFTQDWQGTSGNEFVDGGTSIWEGIKAVAANAVLYKEAELPNISALDHDVAIVVIGERPYAEGLGDIRADNDIIVETGSQVNGHISILESYGNSLELAKLHPEDYQTIKSIAAKGIPVVTLLVSGRTLVINRELELSSAFVATWLPGSEGQGVSDVLFGDYDFQGRLSFSWPEQSHQVSKDDDHRNKVLFPFGFGLNY